MSPSLALVHKSDLSPQRGSDCTIAHTTSAPAPPPDPYCSICRSPTFLRNESPMPPPVPGIADRSRHFRAAVLGSTDHLPTEDIHTRCSSSDVPARSSV